MKMDRIASTTLPNVHSTVEDRYKLRNLITGEELDLRDENKAEFISRLAHMVSCRKKAFATY